MRKCLHGIVLQQAQGSASTEVNFTVMKETKVGPNVKLEVS
jgi:hypothetical protein